jgi:multidrug resistance efflux pump
MNQLFVGIILVMGITGYFLWIENTNLKAENMAYELKHAAQEEALEQLQNDFELQGSALMNIQSKSQEIQNEMNRYLDIFKRHNLSKLAAAKPGLIEPKANKATKEVFDGIEEDSRHIDDLDDNVVELQPVP